jgi:hypothetical protein
MIELGAVKFNEGFVEGWLEEAAKRKENGAERILEAWRLYVQAFDEMRAENQALKNRLDGIQKMIAI